MNESHLDKSCHYIANCSHSSTKVIHLVESLLPHFSNRLSFILMSLVIISLSDRFKMVFGMATFIFNNSLRQTFL